MPTYFLSLLAIALVACSAPSTAPESSSDAGQGADADQVASECQADFSSESLHFALGTQLAAGSESTMCLRWTAEESIDLVSIVGDLGATGHHSLLVVDPDSTEPDGIGPCSEPELMDRVGEPGFVMLAGVSYESSGQRYDFPSAPVQIGLHVDAGAQLIFETHFLNSADAPLAGCSNMELDRGAVVAALQFRTVVTEEQYGLVVPAQGSAEVSYQEPVGADYRVAAASSHMHEGGTHFRMSVADTDTTLHETNTWAEPTPSLFDTQSVILRADQELRIECSFVNESASEQRFPEQMCVGGLYLLSCAFPGAC